MSKILVVDDSDEFGYMVERWSLDQFEYDITIVNDPYKCIRKLQKNNYDLVTIDLYMPDMSGIKLYHYLKKTYPNLKLIIVTNFKDGGGNYFVKPATRNDFFELLKNNL